MVEVAYLLILISIILLVQQRAINTGMQIIILLLEMGLSTQIYLIYYCIYQSYRKFLLLVLVPAVGILVRL